eukprot:359138_1
MGVGATKININEIPYDMQSRHIISGYLKRSFDKYIPPVLINLCCKYYGSNIIDSITITNDHENNDIIINCDTLKQHLFSNGIASKHYFNEFNNKQRQYLWQLLLIKKYENRKPFVTLSQYNNVMINPLHNNDFYSVDRMRMCGSDIVPHAILRSILMHFDHLYAHIGYLGGSSSLLLPFWYVFQNKNDTHAMEYNIYLCYSSYIRNWYPKLVSAYGVNTELYCLLEQCLQLFHKDIYQKLYDECITAMDYGFDIFFIFSLRNKKSLQHIHIIVQIFDYLLLFGVGNVMLFKVAFISNFKDELLQCNGDDIRKTLRNISIIDTKHWNFIEVLKKVNIMRNTLKKTNPGLLKCIMDHPYKIYK